MARITKSQRLEQQLLLTQQAATAAGMKLQIIEALARGGVVALSMERTGGPLEVSRVRITIDLHDDGTMPVL